MGTSGARHRTCTGHVHHRIRRSFARAFRDPAGLEAGRLDRFLDLRTDGGIPCPPAAAVPHRAAPIASMAGRIVGGNRRHRRGHRGHSPKPGSYQRFAAGHRVVPEPLRAGEIRWVRFRDHRDRRRARGPRRALRARLVGRALPAGRQRRSREDQMAGVRRRNGCVLPRDRRDRQLGRRMRGQVRGCRVRRLLHRTLDLYPGCRWRRHPPPRPLRHRRRDPQDGRGRRHRGLLRGDLRAGRRRRRRARRDIEQRNVVVRSRSHRRDPVPAGAGEGEAVRRPSGLREARDAVRVACGVLRSDGGPRERRRARRDGPSGR